MKNSVQFLQVCFCCGVALMLVGCGSKDAKSGHTHFWIGDQTKNVWSYDRVETFRSSGDAEDLVGDFLVQELKQGDVATFGSGVSVTFDGTELLIGKKTVDVEHVQVEADGAIRENAFIKARD